MAQFRTIEALNFRQAIELLKGLSTAGLASDAQPESYYTVVRILCDRVNDMSFDIISNELKYDEFNQLYDSYVNLKYSEVDKLRAIWAESF